MSMLKNNRLLVNCILRNMFCFIFFLLQGFTVPCGRYKFATEDNSRKAKSKIEAEFEFFHL